MNSVTEFLSLAFIHPYGASVVIALLLGLISGCFFLYLKACGVRASMLAAILPSFLNLDLSAGVNRLVDDARFRAGSCVFVYFNQD